MLTGFGGQVGRGGGAKGELFSLGVAHKCDAVVVSVVNTGETQDYA